jgi:hypothetical protein
MPELAIEKQELTADLRGSSRIRKAKSFYHRGHKGSQRKNKQLPRTAGNLLKAADQ